MAGSKCGAWRKPIGSLELGSPLAMEPGDDLWLADSAAEDSDPLSVSAGKKEDGGGE